MFLKDDKPASHWSRSRRRIAEQAYGQWLAFLDRHDALDPSCGPGDRATEERLREFVLELRSRVAPASVGMMVGALLRMLTVLEPARDWTWLGHAYSHFKRNATPTRDKLACMVPATELFALGIRHLRRRWSNAPIQGNSLPRRPAHRPANRLPDAAQEPRRDHDRTPSGVRRAGLRNQLSAAETKTGRPYLAAVPAEVTPYVDSYLEVHRSRLQTFAIGDGDGDRTGRHLWLDRSGRPMSSNAIRDQIKTRTRDAFGKSIWPHLFRDCAVTELVDVAPDDIGVASDLLGHSDLQTTRKHYMQAQGMAAHARIQDMIVARRQAAARA